MEDKGFIFREYATDVEKYCKSKLAGFNVPDHTILEIAEYMTSKLIIMCSDVIVWRDREWKRSLKSSKPTYRKMVNSSDE